MEAALTRKGFDRPDSDSPFLDFVASEFHRRGTPRRAELCKKIHSHPFVEGQGLRVPAHMGVLGSIDELLSRELPERFVLKFASGWSSRGVMLLERLAGGAYFDHMSLRARSLVEIRDEQKRIAASFGQANPRWLLEELVQTTLPVGTVPFDYKFYCFNGVIGMVGQFDRNANPPRFALFDAGFRPLRQGRDYLVGSSRLQRGGAGDTAACTRNDVVGPNTVPAG